MFIDLFFNDKTLQLEATKHSELKKVPGDGSHDQFVANYEIKIPYKNIGRQEQTILDSWARVYLPDEQYDALTINHRLHEASRPRQDDYFEAMLVPAGKAGELLLRLQVIARHYNGKEGELAAAIAACPEFDVAIYAECRGRGKIYIVKDIFTLKLQ